MPLHPGPAPTRPTYRIFLSSGDDATALRQRIDDLIIEAVNSQLLQANVNLRLEVDRWERTAAATNNPGESTNEQFVKRAVESQLTLALLRSRIGQGTREEIEAALEAEQPVSVLWFVPRKSRPRSQVAAFLESKQEHLYFDKTGRPDEEASWHGIVRVLLRLVLDGLQQTPEGFYVERR